jgi:hypothetical protein
MLAKVDGLYSLIALTDKDPRRFYRPGSAMLTPVTAKPIP